MTPRRLGVDESQRDTRRFEQTDQRGNLPGKPELPGLFLLANCSTTKGGVLFVKEFQLYHISFVAMVPRLRTSDTCAAKASSVPTP